MMQAIICGAAALLGMYMIFSDISKARKCTGETVGTVVGTESKLVRGGRRSHREYFPVVEYDVDGSTYWKRADIGSRSASKYPEGSTLDVRYDPDDPEKFMIKGKSLRSGLFSGILLVLFGVLGIYFFTR